ncbi:MAG: hypothetical protein KCHDKBKB_03023 [Elusimicrobia bacterium]|nr:hypothetical protein [Elusimicrobiota bacterium]
MEPFSNELHDIAQEEAFDLGFDALHGRAPDELLMEVEECGMRNGDGMARARCLLSMVMAITQGVTSTREIRDRLAVVVSYMAPDLLCRDLWHGRRDWDQVRGVMARCPGIEWEPVSGRLMVELLTANGWSEREVGKRALCLVYAFVPDESVRPVIARSFATMGQAIGLTATNKRSAISAAMKSLVLEMVRRAQRVSGRKGTGEFWFMKRQHCREALSVAMRGKRNRARKDAPKRAGVPAVRSSAVKMESGVVE